MGRMKQLRLVAIMAWVASSGVAFTQPAPASRRPVGFYPRPIVELLQAGDRHIVLTHPTTPPDLAYPEPELFIPTILNGNPIVFAGRVVEKRPVFMRLRGRRQFTVVRMEEANWIGSQMTVSIDRVIQTLDSFPLAAGQRLTFMDDGDGTAVIAGVRVDTETPWLAPIEPGRRYLITAAIESEELRATGMWMEPAIGGSMRSRLHTTPRPGDSPLNPEHVTPFDGWTVDEASFFLEAELQSRRDRTPR
jgi:hypothetical protein